MTTKKNHIFCLILSIGILIDKFTFKPVKLTKKRADYLIKIVNSAQLCVFNVLYDLAAIQTQHILHPFF